MVIGTEPQDGILPKLRTQYSALMGQGLQLAEPTLDLLLGSLNKFVNPQSHALALQRLCFEGDSLSELVLVVLQQQ